MKEEWRSITGFEGLYQISNKGRVKFLPREFGPDKRGRTRKQSSRISIGADCGNGVLVTLTKERGMGKQYRVHRLVATQFLPLDLFRTQVNHIDGDQRNNNVENLEWCTCDENIHHAFMTGLRYGVKVRAWLDDKHIGDFDMLTKCAKAIGKSPTFVRNNLIRFNKTKTGYRFEYFKIKTA